MRPLEDINEITSHMLEVVQAHMLLSKPQVSLPPLWVCLFYYRVLCSTCSIKYVDIEMMCSMHIAYCGGVRGQLASPLWQALLSVPLMAAASCENVLTVSQVGGAVPVGKPTGSVSFGGMASTGGGYSGASDLVNNGLSPSQNQVRCWVLALQEPLVLAAPGGHLFISLVNTDCIVSLCLKPSTREGLCEILLT